MVPPMAMNWTWRFFRPRSISLLWSRLSTDLMCAALEPAELVFSEVIMFTTLPREPHIAPAEALFLGTYADFAALAHPVCGQPCPSDHLIPVFSPRHTPLPPYLAYIWQIHEVDRYFLACVWHNDSLGQVVAIWPRSSAFTRSSSSMRRACCLMHTSCPYARRHLQI